MKNIYDNVRKNVELPVQDTNHTQNPQVAVDSPSPIKKPNSSSKTSSIVQWLRSTPSCQMVWVAIHLHNPCYTTYIKPDIAQCRKFRSSEDYGGCKNINHILPLLLLSLW